MINIQHNLQNSSLLHHFDTTVENSFASAAEQKYAFHWLPNNFANVLNHT